LAVLRIDQDVPGTGIIDRFITDITDSSYKPLFPISAIHIERTISLLLLMAERRIRSLPRILGLVEAMMIESNQQRAYGAVERHLNNVLKKLSKEPEENRYSISWILYFLKSNHMAIKGSPSFVDPVLHSIASNSCKFFTGTSEFKLFRGVRSARRAGTLLKHLDVFKSQ